MRSRARLTPFAVALLSDDRLIEVDSLDARGDGAAILPAALPFLFALPRRAVATGIPKHNLLLRTTITRTITRRQ